MRSAKLNRQDATVAKNGMSTGRVFQTCRLVELIAQRERLKTAVHASRSYRRSRPMRPMYLESAACVARIRPQRRAAMVLIGEAAPIVAAFAAG